MLQLNKEAARKEFFSQRNGSHNRLSESVDAYNTGSTLVASDAKEYINYCLAKGAEHGYSISPAASTAKSRVLLLSTGGGSIFILETKSQFTVSAVIQPILTPAEMVAAVQKTFMLTVSTSAAVFKVSRPTIYQWLSLSSIEQVRARGDRDRMKELFRLAQLWNNKGPLVGRWLEETLSSGKSVFDLISADTINQKAILEAHDLLSNAKKRLGEAEHARSLASAEAMQSAFGLLGAKEKNRRKGSP